MLGPAEGRPAKLSVGDEYLAPIPGGALRWHQRVGPPVGEDLLPLRAKYRGDEAYEFLLSKGAVVVFADLCTILREAVDPERLLLFRPTPLDGQLSPTKHWVQVDELVLLGTYVLRARCSAAKAELLDSPFQFEAVVVGVGQHPLNGSLARERVLLRRRYGTKVDIARVKGGILHRHG